MLLESQVVTTPGIRYALLVGSYPVLVLTSGHVVRHALDIAGQDPGEEQADTGQVIGKLENVLVLTVVHLHAFTALGLIFAAKSLVRKEDVDSGDTTYYLTVTLANFT
ncbi:MAG: hypothetical protein V5A23_08000 [Halobacteriales archaeon]